MSQSVSLNKKTAAVLPWVIAVSFFMQMLDGTILNTALPAMAKSLGESPLRMQSVVISYLLTAALIIPASGWVADKVGIRRIFFFAILLFTLGSLFCALSDSLLFLIISRIIQGFGGALMVPVGRLAVLRAYPRSQLVEVLGFITLPGMLGPLLGPTLGGWLVEYASWHWIFLINIPIGIIGCWATKRFMPDFPEKAEARFDKVGFVLLGISMVSILIALEGFGELRMPHVQVIFLLTVGLAFLSAYWLHASRAKHPLFSLRLFKTRTFSIGIIGNLFARLGMGSMPFLTPLLLQVGMGFSAAKAGLTMIPIGIAAMIGKSLAKPILSRMGYRNFLLINTIILGVLIACYSFVSHDMPYWFLLIQLAVFGGVNAIQFTAMNTLTLMDLPPADTAGGNSLLSVVMQLSLSMGVAIAAAILDGFGGEGQTGMALLPSFHATYICMGLFTIVSAGIFFQLSPKTTLPSKRTPDASI